MSRCMPTSHHSTSRDTNEINTAGYAAYHIILFYRRGDSVLDSIVEPAYGLWGGGVASRNLNYKESETETGFIPFIFGGYGSVFIEINRAGVTFMVLFLLLSSVNFARINSEMLMTTWLTLLQDVSGAHESHEWDLQLYRRDFFGSVQLLSTIGIQYQNEKLVNYYYGTSTYSASNAFGAELELIATYSTGDWGFFRQHPLIYLRQ